MKASKTKYIHWKDLQQQTFTCPESTLLEMLEKGVRYVQC